MDTLLVGLPVASLGPKVRTTVAWEQTKLTAGTLEAHYWDCLYAGTKIVGANAEVMPTQLGIPDKVKFGKTVLA